MTKPSFDVVAELAQDVGGQYASAGIHDGLLVEVLFQAAILLEADGREVPPVVLDTLVMAAKAGLAGPLTDSRIQATLPMACR